MNLELRLKEIKDELVQLRASIATAKAEELDSIDSQIEGLESEKKAIERKIQIISKVSEDASEPVQARKVAEQPKAEDKVEDIYDSKEYRKAFMEFACRGTEIPAKFRATTATSDASAVIPTTILNEIITKLDTYGDIYARVRKLSVKGGVSIPILSLKPTATWITANTGTSESNAQKIQANTSISFSYYGLECKVAQTLLTEVVTLDMFQRLFVTLVTEAMIKAIESAIISGNGSGKPLGITADTRVPAGNKISLSSTDIAKWDEWKKKVFAKMAKAYRNGVFIMAQGTFDGYIDGMVDSVGQPIGRVNYGITGGETYRFGGKEVLTVEDDLIGTYDSASSGDVFAIFVNLSDYAINSNMQMRTVKWVDNDTNEIKNKAILIVDGKLVDPNGVLLIKKA